MFDYFPLLTALTVLATAVMASSAAVQAVRQNFDPFGGTLLAVVTAIGGGTLRDMLMGATPVFWLTDLTYLATAVPVGFVTYYAVKQFPEGGGRRLRLLMYLDAIGLALFTLVGTQAALQAGLPAVSGVVLGCITGVAGGIFRDVLCGLQPTILKEDFYATISLLGGTLYILCLRFVSEQASLATAFAFITLIRCVIVYRSGRSTDK